ncbi:MAG TPA: methyltransferase domain-containing protein [Longimicrobiales bacterium]|nr:methyltransferase domain-containing protein [Longimicrobiales bacterium]
MLDLVRLSPRRLLPPGGVDLFRQIALLTDLSPGKEVLGVACGNGSGLEYFVREFGVSASGVEEDPRMVELAERWAREHGLGDRLQLQTGRSDALPYRDRIFDVSLGEIGLANHCEPEDALRELVRVTKPGGFVVLVQLVWKAPVDEQRQRVLSEHLGVRPLMVVQWKRLLTGAGVVEIHTEDWSDKETSFRAGPAKPFPDFAELFSLSEKIGVLRRAWRRWGWRGVHALLTREREVHRLLTTERILGLDLLRGRVAPVGEPVPSPGGPGGREEEPVSASVAALPHPGEPERARPDDIAGLPLFDEGSGGEPRGSGR